ncbi:transcription-repair coupling factor [Neptunomonas qingdaonensis]|uniref:Transcription-repair-coupling factor n=1 Tax=Neptunomonas qingdaonensis TaxID=1045558 RepID=A0A1I2RNJ5_9GAMM|nr:transcription-repair coupling factor [Neptunomonas qingdaonensis]SFG42082.1 transcription-repair coupling factor (superfamily II helicase) [Neptunomonas qingdaonensis]
MTNLVFPIPTKPGDIKWIGQAHQSAAGLLIAQAALKHQQLTLVISRNSDTASLLENEIHFYSAAQNLQILPFPDWETLPYDTFSPHQDITSTRVSTLKQLSQLTHGVVIVPISTLMHRIAPSSFLQAHSLVLHTGQQLNIDKLRQQLSDAGYRAVDTVNEHGEYTVRGSIIDLYPMGSETPFRIDLFDDEIDSLRTFDAESQRSIDKIEQIRLLPAREVPLTAEAIKKFKHNWRNAFDTDQRRCPTYQDVSNGFAPPGIEYYLPFFFDDTATLFDYLPKDTLIITDGSLEHSCQQFWNDVNNRYEERRHDIERPILPPRAIFTPKEEFFAALKSFRRLQFSSEPAKENSAGRINLPCEETSDLTVNAQSTSPLALLTDFIATHPHDRILFCAESAGRRAALQELLAKANIKPTSVDNWQAFLDNEHDCALTVYPINRGLSISGSMHVISESQLFGRQVFQRRRRARDKDQTDLIVRNLAELAPNAPVVHLDHGIGRYLGLQTIDLDGQTNEFVALSYANDAKLYVPVSSLHLISRYSGSSDELAPLHRLGTEQWSKARQKAAEKVRDTAAELLDIYARRAARKGFAFSDPAEEYQQFVSGFPFEETPDQEMAITSVLRDMISPQPMDRLICGDVGFGKTEVAMRAAFIAAHSGKQVAILVPTTLLAQQHYDNFKDRFADWPVMIELISRFRSGKQQADAIEKLNNGQIDIIIGTHKLLQGDIVFKNLGLVIIDEEHRFGVQQKERLKSLRSEVDILTMTATPIPRTLNMAMSGMRDLSIIATPPARRLAVKTFVRESNSPLIKEAILRELLRGGQVYYLHNEVKTIEKTAEELAALVPEARIGIGHGQMRERELEQVMADFYHKRHNLLLCTTIIETGIDIPNANTIIIDRADKFGLAQLHQLRGRVGRSHHQAYAYMLTPPSKSISKDANKRLEAIAQAEDLGAGFTLATHDLEIRGAGELLGDDQSGQIQGIGFTLYMEMLEEAIQSIKEGKTPNMDRPLHHGAEVNLHIPALIKDDYLPDVHSRLIMYKRISSAKNETELTELQIEMIDRFGLLPETTKNLFRLTSLKLLAEQLGILKLDAGSQSGRIEFEQSPKVDPFTIVMMIQKQPKKYKLEGASHLRFSLEMDDTEQRFSAVENLLKELGKVNS